MHVGWICWIRILHDIVGGVQTGTFGSMMRDFGAELCRLEVRWASDPETARRGADRADDRRATAGIPF